MGEEDWKKNERLWGSYSVEKEEKTEEVTAAFCPPAGWETLARESGRELEGVA